MNSRWKLGLGATGCSAVLGICAACGSSGSATPSDAGKGSTDATLDAYANPAPCGTIDAAMAAQLLLQGIDNDVSPAAAAFGMIDTSPTLARVLTIGNASSVALVSNIQSDIASLRKTLRKLV